MEKEEMNHGRRQPVLPYNLFHLETCVCVCVCVHTHICAHTQVNFFHIYVIGGRKSF